MRLSILAYGVGALALAGLVFSGPVEAAKSKMGCERGKTAWNATSGKCEPKAKGAKKAASKAKKTAAKKK